jgi:hypothetical protein
MVNRAAATAYLALTSVFTLIRLIHMSDSDKNVEILTLRHQLARRGGQANTRVRDLHSGEDINVTTAEDTAFWEFAAVEILRHAGIRIEELLELTHLSIRQYQRPNGARSSPYW